MRRSIVTTCTSKVKTPVFSLGSLPKQFEATVAWPGNETKFEMQAGPVGTFGGGDEA